MYVKERAEDGEGMAWDGPFCPLRSQCPTKRLSPNCLHLLAFLIKKLSASFSLQTKKISFGVRSSPPAALAVNSLNEGLEGNSSSMEMQGEIVKFFGNKDLEDEDE
ncbi:hypothetical protein SUGI_0313260 [Cryptomeria japonica]|nr:hypothetical protein SUGI_0313260 [Cryptomeria japonica]